MPEARQQAQQQRVDAPDAELIAAGASPLEAATQGAGRVPAVTPSPAEGGRQTASELAYGEQAGGPEIEATEAAMGQHIVAGMNKANSTASLDSGIHYASNYKKICTALGQASRWKEEYRYGHTWAPGFKNPSESKRWLEFELLPGHSASKAIKAWLAGATIAECLTTVIALQIDAVRAAIGDDKFDQLYGSEDPAVDKKVSMAKRLRIRDQWAGTPAAHHTTTTDAAVKSFEGPVSEAELDADLVPGQRYYFTNHPKYLLKHPGGAWQGENAIYIGKNRAGERLWGGLGAADKTDDQMHDAMVKAYNAERTEYDVERMRTKVILLDDGTYLDRRYDPKSGEFPDQITKADILSAPEYKLGAETRKGGFQLRSGIEMDVDKVKQTRDGG